MKTIVTYLKWLAVALITLIVILCIYILIFHDQKFEAPYPQIKASSDSALIARGKHLAYGPAHCGTCHVPMNKVMDVENGEIYPLSGGWTLSIPPGTFRAPNITPHKETGIGNLNDGEIARIMRHMVGADNRVIMPFMPFAELCDEDLTAIISFLKSQAPVDHAVPKSEFTFLGKAVKAFGLIKPEGAKGNPPKSVTIDTSIEYGKYLANSVANCVGCHTARDLNTGKFIGIPFAGGMQFAPDPFSDGRSFVSPNLTPDSNTGIMSSWSQDVFVTRFKTGKIHKGSPMPWGAFKRMDTTELKAIYKYLQSLPASSNKIEKIVFEAGERI